ncbi:hypothetical protein JRO89_XS13G0181100 [Xanthoceras sorbifolium]|uniref:Uncharacterized protein n=1 Tax=Xanthoceras sorbifolium TaxID=99658 RepID=A0ABQ8H929_9ROSI|nr:hypothetical protein JRO89_XS13G0181100 [Xanthoceras sorbifolium]
MNDADDIAAYKKSIERLRVHIFLAGLDGAFEQVQGEILRKDLIPDLEECYVLVHREAVRQTTLKGEYDTSDISAMVAQHSKTSNPKTNPIGGIRIVSNGRKTISSPPSVVVVDVSKKHRQ